VGEEGVGGEGMEEVEEEEGGGGTVVLAAAAAGGMVEGEAAEAGFMADRVGCCVCVCVCVIGG